MNSLSNSYWGLRHAQSRANRKGLIISSPDQGINHFGLSFRGRRELRASLKKSYNDLKNKNFKVYCSDFLRTRQTAEILCSYLDLEEPIITTSLRERYFGKWDGMDNSHYNDVWEKDSTDSGHEEGYVESVDSVARRIWEFIVQEMETRYKNRNILFVSHGDPLQIIQTRLEQYDLTTHRQRRPLETGEIRLFYDTGNSKGV